MGGAAVRGWQLGGGVRLEAHMEATRRGVAAACVCGREPGGNWALGMQSDGLRDREQGGDIDSGWTGKPGDGAEAVSEEEWGAG